MVEDVEFIKDDLPFVDELWIDLEAPDETCEHFNRPWVSEHVLNIWNIHTELVAEALLDIEGDFTQYAVDLGDSLVSDGNLRKIGVLEESVVRLFLFDAQSHSSVIIWLISASLGERDLSTAEHLDVTTILILDSALSIL